MQVLERNAGLCHSLDLLKDTYNYNHWVYDVLRPFIGKRVIEVGSGPGNMTRFLLPAEQVICIEPDPAYVERLNQMCKAHRNVSCIEGYLEQIEKGYIPAQSVDTVLSINVLEHIEDDRRAISIMQSFLEPLGHLILFVPAVEWAFGAMDKELGHHRRYSKSMLRVLLEENCLRIVSLRYFNFVGIWGWWWASRVRGERLINPKMARAMDMVVPYISAIEKLVHPVIGQSLVAIAQKSS